MILVYCDTITPRHEFVFDFMLTGLIGSEFRLTTSLREFEDHTGPKFCYSAGSHGSALHFLPSGLLHDTGIRVHEIRLLNWEGIPVFFKTDESPLWPFDPFSLVFYLISRYEEYLPFEEDEHGRFTAGQSLAYTEGFLGEPVADLLAHKLRKLLEQTFPGYPWPSKPFRLQPTFDIDIAFAHLAKGPWRAAAAWAKLLLKADLGSAAIRMQVLRGTKPDPYDNFDLHLRLAQQYGQNIRYFVLAGDFGRYDRNTTFRHRRFRNLIRNARDAMPVPGVLTVGIEAAEDAVRVVVSDTGVGISPEDLPRITEPLYSTKPRGMGLGLAIARAIVDKNQATMRVASQLGAGSQFTVELKRAGGMV